LAAARVLGRKLQQLVWKDMKHLELTGFEFLIAYVLFLRAERTFSSIRTLARLGMVDDSFALVRVMIEKIINAEYILVAGADVALDYTQYHAFREWRDLEEMKALSLDLGGNHTPEFLMQLRSAHDRAKMRTLPDGSQKNRFGRGHDWTDLGLSKRAEFVDKTLMKTFSMRDCKSTRILYHSTYKKASVYLHGMWVSLARSIELGADAAGRRGGSWNSDQRQESAGRSSSVERCQLGNDCSALVRGQVLRKEEIPGLGDQLQRTLCGCPEEGCARPLIPGKTASAISRLTAKRDLGIGLGGIAPGRPPRPNACATVSIR
jgi:hypothetical protein